MGLVSIKFLQNLLKKSARIELTHHCLNKIKGSEGEDNRTFNIDTDRFIKIYILCRIFFFFSFFFVIPYYNRQTVN